MSDLFSEFNERQRQAVFDTEGNLRVIAGAGSGRPWFSGSLKPNLPNVDIAKR